MTEPGGGTAQGEHERSFVVPGSHPSLAGHFPGAPVVPGVVLLDHVLRIAEAWRGRGLHAVALPQCKFLAPLLPDRPARVRLELRGERLRFEITEADQPLARGEFVLAPERAP